VANVVLRGTAVLIGLFLSFYAANGFATDKSSAASRPVSLAFRFAVDCREKDASEPLRNENSSETLCLSSHLVISNDDVEHADLGEMPNGDVAVWLTLTDAAMQKLSEATRDHRGQQLGVTLNGRLVYAPVIQERILARQIPVAGRFTPKRRRASSKH
jgi:preprotein translocase subunit SecD